MRKLVKHWPLTLAALLAICCAVCMWRLWAVSNTLDSQKAAQRWKGSGERDFAQVSCYMPPTFNMKLDDIYKFRNDMVQKLKAASFDMERETGLYLDAWSTSGTVKVSNGQRSGEVQAVAVGGDFFVFHPLRLVSGSYLTSGDVMDDRVLLDKETAWLLFGASDVAGLSFSLEGIPVVVAGVYEHEPDPFSRAASGDTRRIFMHYSLYRRLYAGDSKLTQDIINSILAISCYELVIAEPVKGFAYSSVTDKFPYKADNNENILVNTYRFEVEQLYKLLKNRMERSMRTGAYVYPYWENAARAAEDRAVKLLVAVVVTGALPAGLLLYWVIRAMVHGKKKLEDDVLPDARAKSREFFREQSRKRWEKKHPGEY